MPHGPPVERHGERALGDLALVERSRARLVASSDLYALGFAPDARDHLAAAETAYAERLSGRVRARDRLLDREIGAAFQATDEAMGALAPFGAVRPRLAPLSDQLIGGAAEALVPGPARTDPGVQAEVLSRLAAGLSEAYAAGLSSALPERRARLSQQQAYGLLARSQGLARGLAPSLGPESGAVIDTLSDVRARAYPVGIQRPDFAAPPREVATLTDRVRRALERRYGLAPVR